MPDGCDIAIDFMDMTDTRHLWARSADIRPGFDVVVDRYAVVGDEDADPRVARIVSLDPDGNVEIEVLHGTVESQLDLLGERVSDISVLPVIAGFLAWNCQGNGPTEGSHP